MNKIVLFFGIIVCLCAVSCDNSSEAEDGVIITLREELNTSVNIFELNCHTEKIYHCCNFPIKHTVSTYDKTIDIQFEGAVEGDFCARAFGPATATLLFSDLVNGTYILLLSSGSYHGGGTLEITDEYYKVDFPKQEWIVFTNSLLERVPKCGFGNN